MFSFAAELYYKAWKAKENTLWEVNTNLIALQYKCSFLGINVWLPVSLALPLKSNRSAMLQHAKSSIYRSSPEIKGLPRSPAAELRWMLTALKGQQAAPSAMSLFCWFLAVVSVLQGWTCCTT